MVKSVVSSLNMPTLEFLKLGDFKLAAYSNQESIQVTEAFFYFRKEFQLDLYLIIRHCFVNNSSDVKLVCR